MKRFLILFTIIILMAIATGSSAKDKSFGIFGGANMAAVYGDFSDGTTSRNGFAGGFFVKNSINPSVAMRFEFSYVQKGAKIEYTDGSEDDAKLEYIEAPMLFDFNLISESDISPHILIGVGTAYNLSGTITAEGVTADVANMRSLDIGLIGGFGINFGSGESSFFIEGRYNLGLFEIFTGMSPAEAEAALERGEIPAVYEDFDGVAPIPFKNHVLSVYAGFEF